MEHDRKFTTQSVTDDYLKLNLFVHTLSADLPRTGSDGYKLI